MILSKADLHNYIHADFIRQEMSHPLMARFTFGEHNRTRKYLYILRHLEYYKNKKKSALGYVLLAIWMLRTLVFWRILICSWMSIWQMKEWTTFLRLTIQLTLSMMVLI